MLTATTQMRRAIVIAVALGAVVASSASARIPESEIAVRSARDADPATAAPSRADIVARREARATAAWRAANPPTIIEVSSSDDGGFDLTSAGIGAAVPLMLILVEVAGSWVLRRRSDTDVPHQPA
jgi:hypothetical protein